MLTVGGGRGVLSSRFFHRPSPGYQTQTILEIKPFDYEKIIQCFKRYDEGDEIVQIIFSDRRDLIPIVKVPFYANLLYFFLAK